MESLGLSTVSFADEGFLQQEPGREFIVQGHGPDNASGLLAFRAVVRRDASDDLIELGNKQGLKLHASFDDAHPALAMIEAIGEVNFVEHLAKDLAALGYRRLPEK